MSLRPKGAAGKAALAKRPRFALPEKQSEDASRTSLAGRPHKVGEPSRFARFEKMQNEYDSPTFKVDANGQRAGKRPGLSALAPHWRERRKQAALPHDYHGVEVALFFDRT